MKQAGSTAQLVYQYVAYGKNGELVKGRLAATSEESIAELLGYDGYRVISVKKFVPFLRLDGIKARFESIKPGEIVLFYRQLALLLESGINIVLSLELLREQVVNRALKGALTRIITDVRDGNQFSAALARHPKIFSQIYARSLAIGEQTGSLEVMLRQIADYIEKESVAAKRTKSALMYPVFALILTVIVVGVLVTFVLPAFSSLYASLGADLPPLTRMMLAVSDISRSYGVQIMLALVAAGAGVYVYIRTPAGKYKWHRLVLRMPLLGHVNHMNELGRCCRSISLLYRAGLPLAEIMSLVIEGSGNKVMAAALNSVRQDMLKGEGLSQPMSKSELFLPMMVQMVKVGEETGNLDATLLAVAQSYETEADDRMRALIALIQPATTLIIGVVVGLVTLSLVSAMYSVYGQMS